MKPRRKENGWFRVSPHEFIKVNNICFANSQIGSIKVPLFSEVSHSVCGEVQEKRPLHDWEPDKVGYNAAQLELMQEGTSLSSGSILLDIIFDRDSK